MTVDLEVFVEPLPDEATPDALSPEAFERLYVTCHSELVEFCRRQLCGRGDPEAVAQEAFLRAWLSLDRFASTRPFWPWLATIARRLCIDHRRRLQRETTYAAARVVWSESSTVPTPEEAAVADDDHRAAADALRLLKPAEQRVITLRDVNGWSYDEIARFEGVTVESVRGSLKRARASLRRSYAGVGGGVPVALGGGILARLKDRFQRFVARHAAAASTSPGSWAGVHDVVLGVAVLAAAVAGDPGASDPHRRASVASLSAPAAESNDAGRVTGSADAVVGGAENVVDAPGTPVAEQPIPKSLLPALFDDGGHAPEATSVTSMTASPNPESDSTLFMSALVYGCAYPPCPALFRSADGGASWARLPAVGYMGGPVLLSPAFPADDRIFVAGPVGLQVSDDGGAAFTTVTGVGGPAALSPRFSAGDPRIVVAGAPSWQYDADTGLGAPAILAFGPAAAGDVAFAADGDGSLLLLGGTTLAPSGRQTATLFACLRGICETRATLQGFQGAPSLALSPRFSSDGLLFAWRGTALFRSGDGGGSVERVTLPFAGTLRSVAFAEDGTVFAASAPEPQGGTGGLARSSDGGRTWERLGVGTPLESGVTTVLALRNGRVLAAPTFDAGGGILCSVDGGGTWERRCMP